MSGETASSLDDRALAARIRPARQGDTESLNQLVDALRFYLLRIADQELDPPLRAKVGTSDLVQETLLRAHQNFQQFKGDSPDNLRAWLRQILLNHLADLRRSFATDKRAVGRELPPGRDSQAWRRFANRIADPSASSTVSSEEEAAMLRAALARLPADYRQVILLRSWERLTFAEVAQRMERSPEAARKVWGRAIKQLRQELAVGVDDGG